MQNNNQSKASSYSIYKVLIFREKICDFRLTQASHSLNIEFIINVERVDAHFVIGRSRRKGLRCIEVASL